MTDRRATPDYFILYFSEGEACSLRSAATVCSVYCCMERGSKKLGEKYAHHCEQFMFIFLKQLLYGLESHKIKKSNLRLIFPLR